MNLHNSNMQKALESSKASGGQGPGEPDSGRMKGLTRKSRFLISLQQRNMPVRSRAEELRKDLEDAEKAKGKGKDNVAHDEQTEEDLFGSDTDEDEGDDSEPHHLYNDTDDSGTDEEFDETGRMRDNDYRKEIKHKRKMEGGAGSKKKKKKKSKLNYTDPSNAVTYLKIHKVKSAKDKIANPDLSEQDIIPRLGTSSILNGTTGQGKSTLLTNLVSSIRFLGGKTKSNEEVFTHKFLISPTALGDDVQKKLGISKEDTFTDLHEAPELIGVIMKVQKEEVKNQGSDKAPQVLIMYDDIISHPAFMRSDNFIASFIACRHYNFTVFVCSQSWTAVPRRCRIQAKNVFFFSSPQSEVELLANEYCPSGMSKRQFIAMVEYATQEPYSFLYINKSVPMEERFRRNLDEIINLEYFRSMEITRSNARASQVSNQKPMPMSQSPADPTINQNPNAGLGQQPLQQPASQPQQEPQNGSGPRQRRRR